MKRSLVLLALCGSLATATAGHLLSSSARSRIPPEDDILFVPSSEALRFLSLGQRELLADLVYLRAVIYFGNATLVTRSFGALVPLIETSIELDPHWKTPYRWGGTATMYNGLPITDVGILESNRFLRQGIAHFPDDWEMPFMLGCNLLFEMHPTDRAEKAKLTAEGASYIQRASLVGGSPPWAALLAATILRKEGLEDAAVRHLEQVYYSTTNETTRTEVRNRLLSLKTTIDFERVAKARADFEQRWRDTLPYVPEAMFVLVGTPGAARLDWRSLLPAQL